MADKVFQYSKRQVELFESLLDAVRKNIETDFFNRDVTAVDELLSFIPVRSLIAYLPEEEWDQFKDLLPAGEEV